MHRTIETGLKNPPAPHSWPTEANGTIYSVHIPIRPDGSIEDGDVAKQTEILLADLETTLVAAGAGPANVPLDTDFPDVAGSQTGRGRGAQALLCGPFTRAGMPRRFPAADAGSGH